MLLYFINKQAIHSKPNQSVGADAYHENTRLVIAAFVWGNAMTCKSPSDQASILHFLHVPQESCKVSKILDEKWKSRVCSWRCSVWLSAPLCVVWGDKRWGVEWRELPLTLARSKGHPGSILIHRLQSMLTSLALKCDFQNIVELLEVNTSFN